VAGVAVAAAGPEQLEAGVEPAARATSTTRCFLAALGAAQRAPGDGLRIFPGRVAGRALWAAPWTPDPTVAGPEGRVRPEVVWAALDCPGGIAAADAADLPTDTAVVLGRMTATVDGLPRPGDPCQVLAWPLTREGRKLGTGSALLGPDGQVLAAATTVWITVARHTARKVINSIL
jgi:hypothetical protein